MIFAVYIGTFATSPILKNVIDRVTGYTFMAVNVQISAQLVSPTVLCVLYTRNKDFLNIESTMSYTSK